MLPWLGKLNIGAVMVKQDLKGSILLDLNNRNYEGIRRLISAIPFLRALDNLGLQRFRLKALGFKGLGLWA